MNRDTRVALVGAVLLTALLSGCGPAWKVIRVSGPPSALAGASDVTLAFDYSQMFVEGRTEQDWVATKTAADPKYPDTWADLKGRYEAAVLDGVRGQVPSVRLAQNAPGAVEILVQVRNFKLGKWIPFAMPPTVMEGGVLFKVGGQVTDEIALTRTYQSSVTQPSVFNHIGFVGYQFGQAGGQLLVSKQPK